MILVSILRYGRTVESWSVNLYSISSCTYSIS